MGEANHVKGHARATTSASTGKLVSLDTAEDRACPPPQFCLQGEKSMSLFAPRDPPLSRSDGNGWLRADSPDLDLYGGHACRNTISIRRFGARLFCGCTRGRRLYGKSVR
jgi:hypothetical protein